MAFRMRYPLQLNYHYNFEKGENLFEQDDETKFQYKHHLSRVLQDRRVLKVFQVETGYKVLKDTLVRNLFFLVAML